MTFLWATRGRTWGFRFLRTRGAADPLPIYEAAFAGLEDQPEAWRRVPEPAPRPGTVALRFADPLGRKDRAGRAIRHDFVVFPPLADEIDSVDAGRRRVWPLVEDEFERAWGAPEPPAPTA